VCRTRIQAALRKPHRRQLARHFTKGESWLGSLYEFGEPNYDAGKIRRAPKTFRGNVNGQLVQYPVEGEIVSKVSWNGR
jgi:hypothetical protein